MFRTNTPVTSTAFYDRKEELGRLDRAVVNLMSDEPEWCALIGMRKVGKTSLLLELKRRHQRDGPMFAVIDSYEDLPVSLYVFRRFALRVVDAFFSKQTAVSLESLAARPKEYRAALMRSEDFNLLSPDLRAWILEIADVEPDRPFVEMSLKLPELLATALNARCVVAWDEFQELGSLSSAKDKIDILALLRATWQRHERVGYIISGSKRTMLEELLLSPASPFFQHFQIIDVGPMPVDEGVALLRQNAPKRDSVSKEVAQKAVEILGGHPFYLQLFGETLTRYDPPYDDESLRSALGELLFSRTGRLSLYFQREYDRTVGRAGTLAAVLQALSDGPLKPSAIAKATKSRSGATARYIERLGDTVVRTDEGRYAIADRVFALWLRWKKPGGTVVPMTVIGDEAELSVARALAEMGFELVYQSRASRGAFDLLAIRAGVQLGVQVKRSELPLRFKKSEWNRMEADARRFGWRFVVAAVSEADGSVKFLSPESAKKAKTATLDASAIIDNLLAWM
jgi:AAA+ ATPase superfamily predicted ATPase/Holliday junction resolvase